MKFTVVMPSYLGPYRTAAKNRESKILRAVNSVLAQTYEDWELIVVADGCQKTMQIMSDLVWSRVKCIMIEKDKIWGGSPRNTGIELAKGEFIVYLDIDDIFGTDHLKNIALGLNGYDWVWFDDIRWSVRDQQWYDNPCNIYKLNQHGTSNICHKASLPYRWSKGGYGHDYFFIASLKQNRNFAKIQGGEYYVCHIPGTREGYDI